MGESSCLVIIHCCGPNANFLNLRDTLNSIIANAGQINLKFVIVCDSQDLFTLTKQFFHETKNQDLLIELIMNNNSWAKNSNEIIYKYLHEFEYFLFSQDDLKVETSDFLSKSIKKVKDFQTELGWITFTSIGYYGLKKPISNSVREGFFLDRNEKYLFETASFANVKRGKIELPSGIVRAHAPYAHLNLISTKSLEKIGPFPEWTNYTILLDEDQGLRALNFRLVNIWIPDIEYFHPLRSDLRKIKGIRYSNDAHKAFKNQWGMNFPYSSSDIEFALGNFHEHFTWTAGKCSWQWEYIIA